MPGNDVGQNVIKVIPHKVQVAGVGQICANGLEKPVLCRNLEETPILAGFGLVAARHPAVAVAVGMWEPAFGAGFQAPANILFGTLHG